VVGARLFQALAFGLLLGFAGMLTGTIVVALLEAADLVAFDGGFGMLWAVAAAVLGAAGGMVWGLVRKPD